VPGIAGVTVADVAVAVVAVAPLSGRAADVNTGVPVHVVSPGP